MADLKLGNIKPVGADNVVVDGKYVKGGFVVVSSTTERDALKGSSGENIVNGSLCYCTGDSKFYQYNGTTWVEKTFGSAAEASQTAAGLMSADDKKKLDGIAPKANKYEHPSTHAASMITGLSTVATSGAYVDLTGTPDLSNYASTTDIAPLDDAEIDALWTDVPGINEETVFSMTSGYIPVWNGQTFENGISLTDVETSTVTIDQSYNPNSDNAVSGKAVAEAIAAPTADLDRNNINTQLPIFTGEHWANSRACFGDKYIGYLTNLTKKTGFAFSNSGVYRVDLNSTAIDSNGNRTCLGEKLYKFDDIKNNTTNIASLQNSVSSLVSSALQHILFNGGQAGCDLTLYSYDITKPGLYLAHSASSTSDINVYVGDEVADSDVQSSKFIILLVPENQGQGGQRCMCLFMGGGLLSSTLSSEPFKWDWSNTYTIKSTAGFRLWSITN